jgi:hypothetical protein
LGWVCGFGGVYSDEDATPIFFFFKWLTWEVGVKS